MPVIAFFANRSRRNAACAPLMAAFGIGALGFAATYVRCGSSDTFADAAVPKALPGVDTLRGDREFLAAVVRQTPLSGSLRDPGNEAPEGGPSRFTFLDFDSGEWDGERKLVPADMSVIVDGRNHDLSGTRARHDRPWLLRCEAVSRGSRRLGCTVPALSAAEIHSLLNGVPLPRVRLIAAEIAAEVLRHWTRRRGAPPEAAMRAAEPRRSFASRKDSREVYGRLRCIGGVEGERRDEGPR